MMALPDSLDWRSKGVVAPVQDQGSLGRADIIAAVGEIDSENLW